MYVPCAKFCRPVESELINNWFRISYRFFLSTLSSYDDIFAVSILERHVKCTCNCNKNSCIPIPSRYATQRTQDKHDASKIEYVDIHCASLPIPRG